MFVRFHYLHVAEIKEHFWKFATFYRPQYVIWIRHWTGKQMSRKYKSSQNEPPWVGLG